MAQARERPSLGYSSLGQASWVGSQSFTPAPDSCPDLGPKEKGESCLATAKETEKLSQIGGE